MRKCTLLLLLMLACQFTFAQKLLDTGKVWNILENNFFNFQSHSWEIKAGADTIISSFSYKKIRQTDSILNGPYHSSMLLMREDSSKKVFYIDWNHPEFLMYDFSLNQSDTFNTQINSWTNLQMIVDSVDSVVLLNGEKRKRMHLGGGYETWIEGIGSTKGLFSAFIDYQVLDIGAQLLCFAEHGIQKYYDPMYSSCYYSTLGIQKQNQEIFFNISPNPAQGLCTIEISSTIAQIVKFELFDISARVIKTTAITEFKEGKNKIEWDASELNSGIYFLKIEGENFSETKKVAVVNE